MYQAIVLAGGAAHRLDGVAKPQLLLGRQTLLDRTVAAVSGADRIVIVGPDQPVAADVVFCREDPPGAGPVAAIATGLAETSADVLVVLAADLPWIAPAVPRLLAALPPSGAALLVDAAGRANYLAGAWRRTSLASALARIGDPAGAPVRALVETVTPAYVRDEDGWGRDCDTWDDMADARSRLEEF